VGKWKFEILFQFSDKFLRKFEFFKVESISLILITNAIIMH
jgi:hypothetical protein